MAISFCYYRSLSLGTNNGHVLIAETRLPVLVWNWELQYDDIWT